MGETELDFDVAVVGAGAAGTAAALAAADAGARVVLVESAPYPGGELVSGLPILGTRNARGERIVGGVLDQLLAECGELDGYLGDLCDWRTMYGTCVDPEVVRLVVVQALARAGVTMLVAATAQPEPGRAAGTLGGLVLHTRAGSLRVRARQFVDATGDATVAAAAGAEVLHGDAHGGFQPVSLVFRLGGVDFDPLLEFVRDHPEEFMLAENPAIATDPARAAAGVHASGLPYVAMTAERPDTRMSAAIASGDLYPTTGIWMWPTSLPRHELGFNTTRVAGVDATDPVAMGRALAQLTDQVRVATAFLRKHLPGFAASHLAAAAPRVGIRETRRVVAEELLSTADAVAGRKRPDGIAKGGHHVDLHGAGTYQKRVPMRDGASYDIPFAALVPRGVENVLVPGRAISAERDANGSARVMGTCLATGQAAGAAAATAAATGVADVRGVDVTELRQRLRDDGAILDGTA